MASQHDQEQPPPLPATPAPPLPKSEDRAPSIHSYPASAEQTPRVPKIDKESSSTLLPAQDRNRGDGDAATSGRRPSTAPIELEESVQFFGLENDIAKLNEYTTKLQEMCTKLGTEGDSTALRERIWKLQKEGEVIFKACYKKLKKTPESKESLAGRINWFKAEIKRFKKACLRVPMRGDEESVLDNDEAEQEEIPLEQRATKDLNDEDLKVLMERSAESKDYASAHRYQCEIERRKKAAEDERNRQARIRAASVKIEERQWESKRCRAPKLVRLVGVLFGLLAIAYSLFEIATYNSNDPADAVRYVCFTFFGILILLAEFRFGSLLEWFSLLKTASGLGCFYLFVGLCAVGRGGIFGWIVFSMAAFVSVFYFIMACSCRKMYYDDDSEDIDLDDGLDWK